MIGKLGSARHRGKADCCNGCPSRKSYPRVAMMQSGKDWYGDDSPGSLDGSS
jgi:hypothetical protein